MQVSKAKKGYKLVDSGFGKEVEIPEEWDLVKLIEKCSKKPKYGANESAIKKNTKLPRYIRITDLNNDGSLREEEWKSITNEAAEDYLLEDGDILFARTGATVGKSFLYKKEFGKCAFAGYLIRFKLKQHELISKFLFQFTHSFYYWNWLKTIQTIGVQPNVNAEQYSNMPIILPPIKEQQKISSILSNVDQTLEKTNQLIQKTKLFKRGLIQKLLTKGIGHTKFKKIEWLFGKIIEIPEEWEVKSIDEIAYITMGQSPSKETYNEKDGIPLLNGPTEFGPIHPTPIQYTSKPTKICKINDILLCVRGSTTGRLNTADQPYCIGRGIASIRGKQEFANTKWLLQHFIDSQKTIYNNASGGGSTFPNIGQDMIKEITIPIPPLSEQIQIADILSNVDSQINKEKLQKSNLEILKKGLMQKLLTGQIRVKV